MPPLGLIFLWFIFFTSFTFFHWLQLHKVSTVMSPALAWISVYHLNYSCLMNWVGNPMPPPVEQTCRTPSQDHRMHLRTFIHSRGFYQPRILPVISKTENAQADTLSTQEAPTPTAHTLQSTAQSGHGLNSKHLWRSVSIFNRCCLCCLPTSTLLHIKTRYRPCWKRQDSFPTVFLC